MIMIMRFDGDNRIARSIKRRRLHDLHEAMLLTFRRDRPTTLVRIDKVLLRAGRVKRQGPPSGFFS